MPKSLLTTYVYDYNDCQAADPHESYSYLPDQDWKLLDLEVKYLNQLSRLWILLGISYRDEEGDTYFGRYLVTSSSMEVLVRTCEEYLEWLYAFAPDQPDVDYVRIHVGVDLSAIPSLG